MGPTGVGRAEAGTVALAWTSHRCTVPNTEIPVGSQGGEGEVRSTEDRTEADLEAEGEEARDSEDDETVAERGRLANLTQGGVLVVPMPVIDGGVVRVGDRAWCWSNLPLDLRIGI